MQPLSEKTTRSMAPFLRKVFDRANGISDTDADLLALLTPGQHVSSRRVELSTHNIHYLEAGSGDKTLLLVHGAGMCSLLFNQQLESLSNDFRVIAIDLPGHGDSSALNDLNNPLVEMAHALIAFVEALNLSDILLLGHSMGGAVVQQALCAGNAAFNARLAGVVLLSTLSSSRKLTWWGQKTFGTFAKRINKPAADLLKKTIAYTNKLSENGSHDSLIAASMIRLTFGRHAPKDAIEATAFMGAYCPAETKTAVFQALLDFCLFDELANIDIPTLLIGGTRDPLTSAGMLRATSEQLPDATLTLLDGVSHMLMYEDPALFDVLVREFTQKIFSY